MSADTNYNQAIQRGDVRFLILTSDQALYIASVVETDLNNAAALGDSFTLELGKSILKQLESKP